MPPISAPSTIRDARSLAQKLHSQCRDSSNGFKTLAPPLRKLRNVLEDLEESSAEDATLWTCNPRFMIRLDACAALLQELELSLQSYRCSTHKWQDVDEKTIARLHDGISEQNEELATLQEAMSASDPSPLTALPRDDYTPLMPQPTPMVECDGDTFMIMTEAAKMPTPDITDTSTPTQHSIISSSSASSPELDINVPKPDEPDVNTTAVDTSHGEAQTKIAEPQEQEAYDAEEVMTEHSLPLSQESTVVEDSENDLTKSESEEPATGHESKTEDAEPPAGDRLAAAEVTEVVVDTQTQNTTVAEHSKRFSWEDEEGLKHNEQLDTRQALASPTEFFTPQASSEPLPWTITGTSKESADRSHIRQPDTVLNAIVSQITPPADLESSVKHDEDNESTHSVDDDEVLIEEQAVVLEVSMRRRPSEINIPRNQESAPKLPHTIPIDLPKGAAASRPAPAKASSSSTDTEPPADRAKGSVPDVRAPDFRAFIARTHLAAAQRTNSEESVTKRPEAQKTEEAVQQATRDSPTIPDTPVDHDIVRSVQLYDGPALEDAFSPIDRTPASSPPEQRPSHSVSNSIFTSPFAIFDPLSVDIESASSFLLGDAEAEPIQHGRTTRAGSQQTVLPTVQEAQYVVKVDTPLSTKAVEEDSIVETSEQSEQTSLAAATVQPTTVPAIETLLVEDTTETQDAATTTTAIRDAPAALSAPLAGTGPQPSDSALPIDLSIPDDLAAGLGITFEPVSFKPAIGIDGQGSRSQDAETLVESEQAAPGSIPTIVMDLDRTDSVHGSTPVTAPSETSDRPVTPVQRPTTANPDAEGTASDGDATKTSRKAKWLGLKQSTSPSKPPPITQSTPHGKFSLHQKFRMMSFRSKPTASEPSRREHKTFAADAVIEKAGMTVAEDTQEVTTEPQMRKEEPDTATPLIPTTPLPLVSPLLAQDKALPAIPPPHPERRAPVAPVVKQDALSLFPSPPPQSSSIRKQSNSAEPPSAEYITVPGSPDDLYGSSRPASPTKLLSAKPAPAPEADADRMVSPIEETLPKIQDEHKDEVRHSASSQDRARGQVDLSDERYFVIELDDPDDERMKRQLSIVSPERSPSSAPSSLNDEERDRPLGSSMVSPPSTAYSVDVERLERLYTCWRDQNWDRSAVYLRSHLDAALDQGNTDAARRVMHLLGVCTSYNGQWQRALGYFIATIRAPVSSIDTLDVGDMAAFYWLGDTYALLNRRTEALVAYSVALQINNRRVDASPSQAALLADEISSLLLGATPQELIATWDKIKKSDGDEKTTDSILARSVLEPIVVTASLEVAAQCRQPPQYPPQIRTRAAALSELDGSMATPASYASSRLTAESFKRGTPWPEPYDPTFVAFNVAVGRLCDQPTDILTALVTQPLFKVPRSGPVGATRLESFTCNNLDWLIVAIRQCLKFLDMRWDEMISDRGVWYMCRFADKSRNVVTSQYFIVSLFKQTMLPGYGVDVCPDGVRSARILAVSADYIDGVRVSCDKRLRKLIRDYLAHAYKGWVKDGKKPMSDIMSPTTSTSVREQAAGLLATAVLMPTTPAMPLKEKAVYV